MKYLLTIDKITINSNSPLLQSTSIFNLKRSGFYYLLDENIVLKTTTCLDKYYNSAYEIYIEGEKIAEIFTDSKLKNGLSKIAFSKHILYTQPGLRYYIKLLENAGIYADSINYLELALDYQQKQILIERICKLRGESNLSRWTVNPRYVQTSARGKKNTHFNSFSNDSELTFGASAHSNKGNGKQIILYIKSEKLESYQTNYFAANSFDMGKPIQRIEARIKTNWLNKQRINKNKLAITLNDLFDKEILNTLFKKAVGNTFIFNDVKKEKTKNKYRHSVYQTIDIFPLDFLTSTALPTLPIHLTEDKERNNRITIKTLAHQYIAKGTKETAEALKLSTQTLSAPKGKDWEELLSKYAKDYSGKVTTSILDRLNNIIPLIFN